MSTWFDSVDENETVNNDVETEEEETDMNEDNETTTTDTETTDTENTEVKKRTRRPRDPNAPPKPPVPNVSPEIAIEIVKLWNDFGSRDELAAKLGITPEQVSKTVGQMRQTYKKKIEQAREVGDIATAEKIQKLLDTRLTPKPKGKGGGKPNVADEILADLFELL